MPGHDIIAIGSSMGGIEALRNLLSQLPEDLPAAIFVVQHTSPEAPGVLPSILDKAGPLPAVMAQDGEPIHPGQVYVAPPDYHLQIQQDHVQVVHGPRENRFRPAIDVLFRTAAVAYRSRVIGVLLTGLLDDGVAGLLAVRRSGGIVVVQDPADAAYPDLPRRALEVVEVDYKLPLSEMGAVLDGLARKPAGEAPPVSEDLKLEAHQEGDGMSDVENIDKFGTLAPFVCPECGGSLWEVDSDGLRRYRCHVGHAFTARALLADQDETVEQALWEALRTMEDRANVLEVLARDERADGRPQVAAGFEERAAASRGHAEQIRRLLLNGD